MEVIGLKDIADIFALWMEGLSSFWTALNTPIQQLFDQVLDIIPGTPLISVIYDIVDWISSGWLSDLFGSFTLLHVILGGSIFFFAFVTLVKWVIDILP